ncbi:MAG: hypothetical protein A2161_05295 [Candidatus Schekmanbacteria bacterium RBG_13_48_7]|uniref:Uncharacterized protein n=1 Tax=Candidatus Schekmanbacteria bacterium RBG_13_48_7 TaxID=1817878 RepID=A0A1F7RKT3_9BACT|nr:MAG: hypothetical protein A2161_05295 [Candidatus Schekmanbacteria bacterium RBG_13_48_7]
MTSINVLKLNYHSGILLCDEARFWNPEWMIFYTPDKIRPVLREDIMKEQDLLLFFGQTGTSSIGDEFFDRIEKEIGFLYDKKKKTDGKIHGNFMSVEELAHFTFKVITEIKQVHLDDFLKGKFGFTTADLIRGEYEYNNEMIPIEDEEIIKSAYKFIMFENNPKEIAGIYGNSQIMAGYDSDSGFRIFYMTERMPVCEEVQEIFLAQGSGRDTCDLQYSYFASSRPVRDRRGNIDKVTGLVAMLKGLAYACKQAAGVGGYPKIIYVNAEEKNPNNRIKTVFDKRSKLAMEIVLCGEADYITRKNVNELVDQLVYHDEPFEDVHQRMVSLCSDEKRMFSFLRGYTI